MTAKPHISVVIPTCDRPEDVARCLASLASVSYPNWDIVIVDQGSNGDAKDIASARMQQLPQLRYYHLQDKNASLARNFGLATATGEIVAFLDDDCTVAPDWLQRVVSVFARHPRAAMVFGTVRAVEHDDRECFIPAFDAREERRITKRWAFGGIMGASMYLRKASLAQQALFDPSLGPGARPFSSCQDWDFAYRVLRAGGFLVKTPSVVVDHYGSRDYRSGAAVRLFRSCAFSTGGFTMKMLRCGDPAAALLLAVQLRSYLARLQLGNLVLLRRPTGLAWTGWYVRGLMASFRLHVDRRSALYRPKAELTDV